MSGFAGFDSEPLRSLLPLKTGGYQDRGSSGRPAEPLEESRASLHSTRTNFSFIVSPEDGSTIVVVLDIYPKFPKILTRGHVPFILPLFSFLIIRYTAKGVRKFPKSVPHDIKRLSPSSNLLFTKGKRREALVPRPVTSDICYAVRFLRSIQRPRFLVYTIDRVKSTPSNPEPVAVSFSLLKRSSRSTQFSFGAGVSERFEPVIGWKYYSVRAHRVSQFPSSRPVLGLESEPPPADPPSHIP